MNSNNRHRGYTLIELMVVVAIVALLASVALPQYFQSVAKGRRAQGRTALAELLQQQERYLTQRNCYLAFTSDAAGVAAAASSCGVTPSSVPMKVISGDTLGNSAYHLSAQACPADGNGVVPALSECVQVSAAPLGDDPKVGVLSMTSTGVKSCTGTTPSLCWP